VQTADGLAETKILPHQAIVHSSNCSVFKGVIQAKPKTQLTRFQEPNGVAGDTYVRMSEIIVDILPSY